MHGFFFSFTRRVLTGSSGAVFTKDLARALRISSKIRAGTVCVNCALMVGPQAPMGGFKMSGSGRELGEYALRHYTETKTVWIRYFPTCIF